MPRRVKELSAVEVKRLAHPGGANNWTAAVGGVAGLLLQITPNGGKSWLYRYTIDGNRRTMGLGGYPSVTLGMARERARDAADKIWRGEDPLHERHARRDAIRFTEAMEKYLEIKSLEFSSKKYAKSFRSDLVRHALPVLGDMRVDQIERQDVLKVLGPIWQVKTATAKKLRGKIQGILDWCIVNGNRSGTNPAAWKGNLEYDLASASRLLRAKQVHRPALTLVDAPDWFADVRGRNGIATRALEFLALTATRSGEVRGATWEEIDFDTRVWTIPAARMKPGEKGARHEHRVPLTDDMVHLLSNLPRMQHSPYVFPASRRGALSDQALSACMKRINAEREGGYLDAVSGRPAVPHGLRSTFRDWAAERGVDHDLAEITLAHVVGSEVERAYRRSDMIERRRKVLDDWARYLMGDRVGKVVSLGAVT